MKNKKYSITCSRFVGDISKDNYVYQLSFNRSLEHTGKFKAMEFGLNLYRFWIFRKLIDLF